MQFWFVKHSQTLHFKTFLKGTYNWLHFSFWKLNLLVCSGLKLVYYVLAIHVSLTFIKIKIMIIRLYSLGSIGKICKLSMNYISHHEHSLKPVFLKLSLLQCHRANQKQYNYSRIKNLFLPNEIRKLIGKKFVIQ